MESQRPPRTIAQAKLEEIGEGTAYAGRSLWLAGLGVIAAAERQGKETFERLVRRGARYEQARRAALAASTARAARRARRVREWAEGTVEAGLNDLTRLTSTTLGLPGSDDLAILNRRIEHLGARVDAWRAAAGKPRS